MRAVNIGWVALAAALCAAPAGAEVLLFEVPADGSLAVDISATPTGPWTPMGSVTSYVLNPSGDLYGDGMPGWDSRGASVLSAWIRPGSGVLLRSLGVDVGWQSLDSIPTPGAIGQPVVDVLTDGWSVAWQQADATTRRVLVTGTTPDGRAVAPVVVSTGALVGTAPNGNLLHVITMDPMTGILWCTTVSFAFVPTQPIPITIQVIGRVQLGRGGQWNPAGGQPGNNAAGGGSALPGEPSDIGGSFSAGDPHVHDTKDRQGNLGAVVTWWTDSSTLSWAKLGKDGPVLPVQTASGRDGSRHPQKLIDFAIKQASQD